jgi:hypothetical protein
MALNSTGPISLAGTTTGQSIEVELGGTGTTQISLNCTSVRTLAGVPSGAIVMPTNFYGKANEYNLTISANQTNYCLRAAAITAGWNGTTKLIATINAGVYISSNAIATPALTVTGSFPNGVTIINNGTIAAIGGGGGYGGYYNVNGGTGYGGQVGFCGGTALKVLSAVTVNNTNGIIAGGGGGGGGGAGKNVTFDVQQSAGGGGGGGGRSGKSFASGGSGGPSYPACSNNGSPGGSGTCASAGSGGAGGCCFGFSPRPNGGDGGTWGASGSTGIPTLGEAFPGGAGGNGGKATCGAGTYITWSGTGTRYGSVS